ncbi:nitric oxide synthase, inducible-like [Centruroides vittatus]|uniref:nitric oxide synthase, inducible-like n=1 Tax=Centruroides vittatus TaxID=120091 RepID=UPI00350F11AF
MKIEESNAKVEERRCPFSGVKIRNYLSGRENKDKLYQQSKDIACQKNRCYGSFMAGLSGIRSPTEKRSKREILEDAKEFFEQYFESKKIDNEARELRIMNVKNSIESTGTYELSEEELLFGAKMAWRNASRCIGRIQWNRLILQDARHVRSTKEMFEKLCEHLALGTNGGNIRSVITVFPQRQLGRDDYRLWNPQLLSFAGYLQPDGSVVGDPGRVKFTRICQRLGWKGRGGKYDILPWVLSSPDEGPQVYDIPEELVLRIHLEHPNYPWFKDLGYQWYAVPAVANMMLDCGGLTFTAAPFNGWYMGTEIGARDLCDPQRYNITEEVGSRLGIDTSNTSTLWKDRVLLEVNLAVLYSFQKNKVTIVDHHTASETFIKHFESEQKQRGGCPADWVWIVPPMSGSITSVFHQEMLCYSLKPSYEYQEDAWLHYQWPKNNNITLKYKFASISKVIFFAVVMNKITKSNREAITILYATETGKSETYAMRLEQILSNTFLVRNFCMQDYDLEQIVNESILIVISSTFGNGEPPDNGKEFWKKINRCEDLRSRANNQLKFSVFALGSTQYPTFCAFGKNLDSLLSKMGQRILPVELGDELRGQEQTFNKWAEILYKALINLLGLKLDESQFFSVEDFIVWKPENYKLNVVSSQPNTDICRELSRLHSKRVLPYKLLSCAKLQARHSSRQTVLVRFLPSSNDNLDYFPGDHIGVFASNSPKLVNDIVNKIDTSRINPDDILDIQCFSGGKWSKASRLPPCSLRTAMTKFLDLTTPPTANLLLLMSSLATEKWDVYRLKKLATDIDEYEEWKSAQYPNLADFLEEFNSVKLTPEFILTQLPLLQPRYYSVSSSTLSHPYEILLTVAVLNFRSHDGKGKLHHGLCSNYLNSYPKDDIPIFVRSAPGFHLPADVSLPIIMIGAGSGIAPFKSFWMHKEMETKQMKIGKLFLFFGCRQRNLDLVYEHETSPLVRKGILSRVFNVFSREPNQKKKYVQDAVKDEAKLVYEMIQRNGHIYVCGDAAMSEGVRKAVKYVLVYQGNYSKDEAENYFIQLQNDGRYHEDVFGVSYRGSSSL